MGAAGVDQREEGVLGHPLREPLQLAVAQQAGRVEVAVGKRETGREGGREGRRERGRKRIKD